MAETGSDTICAPEARRRERAPDPEAMSLESLEDAICVHAAASAAQMCRWLGMIAEFDRREGWVVAGLPSCADWLSYRCSASPGAAREHVRVARALVDLPQTRALFASGALSYSKVRALTRVVTSASEPEMVPIARTATAAQLERIVRGYRAAAGVGLARQAKRSMVWRHDDDGMYCLRLRMTPEEGATILAAMRAAATAAETDPVPSPPDHRGDDGGRGGGSDRPDPSDCGLYRQESINADALIAVCEGFLACAATADASGEDTTTVIVHVDADQLGDLSSPSELTEPWRADPSEEPALRPPRTLGDSPPADSPPDDWIAPSPTSSRPSPADPIVGITHLGSRCGLENGPGVEPATARRLACDSAVVAMLHDQAGDVLHVGRKTRRIGPALRRALRSRDGGCRYPGCRRRRHLNAHHVRHWADGGPTDLDNLVLLCRRHHMLLHEAGYGLVGTPGGRMAWLRPDGRPLPDQLPSGDSNALRAAIEAADREAGLPYDRNSLLPAWAGERFELREIVWVLLQPNVLREQAARGGTATSRGHPTAAAA